MWEVIEGGYRGRLLKGVVEGGWEGGLRRRVVKGGCEGRVAKGCEMYEKVLGFTSIQSTSINFCKQTLVFQQNGVKCMKKYWFYRSRKSRSMFVKYWWSDTHTH